MNKDIIKIKFWFNPNLYNVLHTRRNGDKYLTANDGSVWVNEYGAVKYDSTELEVPHSNNNDKWVAEMDGIFGVYDSNMKLLQEYSDIGDILYDLTGPYPRWNKDDFYGFECE